MSEAEEIDAAIADFGGACADWATSLANYECRLRMFQLEENLRKKIQSIITERDQLRKAAQSHRGKG